MQFYNCQCIGANQTIPEPPSVATIGYCKLECSNFWVYMVLFSVFVFIHSTSEVGSMLLILRCVDPRDKAMALGLIQFAIGLFGNYLSPALRVGLGSTWFSVTSNLSRIDRSEWCCREFVKC